MARVSVATSTFTGADGTHPANFTDLNGADSQVRIKTNKYTVPFGAMADSRWTGAGTFTDDQYAKSVVSGLANPGGLNIVGVIGRAGAGVFGARNMYRSYVYEDNTTTIRLEKCVNDTVTSLGSVTTGPLVNGDTIEIECEGTTIRALRNGTAVITVTDTAHATGLPGICGKEGFSADLSGDDWEAGNLTATIALLLPLTFQRTNTLVRM